MFPIEAMRVLQLNVRGKSDVEALPIMWMSNFEHCSILMYVEDRERYKKSHELINSFFDPTLPSVERQENLLQAYREYVNFSVEYQRLHPEIATSLIQIASEKIEEVRPTW